uniref:Protein translocase subunit SecA n=1 Tax=Scinaia undulata TaxID=1884664 RepID=A0A1G4NXE7_9FLOR|nr:Preprotein-translocase subunit a [Scinaia undulata]SCW23338.1 Preprotein-translocase subunit a [Scinaia undulata]
MLNILPNRRNNILRRHQKTLKMVKEITKEMESWSDEKLQNQTAALKAQLKNGRTLNDILPEAFATIKETCKRILKINLFEVQILGGVFLHEGNIAEMKTGEGKTLTATLPAYLNSLSNKGVHIITVNDYLAKRDSEWVSQIYRFLGITVGLVQQNMNNETKKQNYLQDITYITNSEVGFDYLRDNMAISTEEIVQRTFAYCIIDEVDSILIDEARTPLIISGPSAVPTKKYIQSYLLSQKLIKEQHYKLDEKAKNITLNEQGIIFCEEFLRVEDMYQVQDPWAQYVVNAIKAKELFIKDRHYIKKDDEVIIVDEFTGRIMPGRRWSDGLHQAIEAKENVKIQEENQTLASITYQNFFLLYPKLSGMTGTASTEAQEFEKIYKTNVIEIPTNKPCIRQDLPDLVYKREYDKWVSIANECYDMYKLGKPTLIGTTNVEKSELLARLLDEYQIPYNLLNAKPKNVKKESEIIAQAGQFKTITIATNMAGRGTDIILGGNPEQLAKLVIIRYLEQYIDVNSSSSKQNSSITPEIQQILDNMLLRTKTQGTHDIQKVNTAAYVEEAIYKTNNLDKFSQTIQSTYGKIHTIYKHTFAIDRQKVIELGGLHVIGTERHESRRIDNQLRGRAGRQGDPGSSRFFLSLEDHLLRIFGGDKIINLMETLNIDDDTPIESKILSRSLNNAQKKVELYYYDIRKQLFEYDEVLNNQRQAIYAERNRILYSAYIRDCIIEYGESTIDEILSFYTNDPSNNIVKINHKLHEVLNLSSELINENMIKDMSIKEMQIFLYEQLRINYDLRESYLEQLRPGLIRQLEKYYLLQQIDRAWQDHLEKMTNLRESIGWRSYGQQDPLTEYKNEAFSLFVNMITYIRETVSYLVMRSRLVIEPSSRIKQ